MDIAATFDEEPFRHSDPKYKCCCGHVHVKQGVRYLCIFTAVAVVCGLLNVLFDFGMFSWSSILTHLGVVLLLAIVAFCLFWAIRTENEKLLIPYLVYLALGVLFCLFLLVVSLWSLIDPRSEPARVANNFVVTANGTGVDGLDLDNNRQGIQAVSAIAAVLSLVGIAVCIWFSFVVYKYYLYLIAMKRARNPQNVVHHDMNTLKKEVRQ